MLTQVSSHLLAKTFHILRTIGRFFKNSQFHVSIFVHISLHFLRLSHAKCQDSPITEKKK